MMETREVHELGHVKTLDTHDGMRRKKERKKEILKSCKKNQPDARLILNIFRQPVHVSGVSRPIITRYNRMYTTIVLIILKRG